jgi:hypothetical protein
VIGAAALAFAALLPACGSDDSGGGTLGGGALLSIPGAPGSGDNGGGNGATGGGSSAPDAGDPNGAAQLDLRVVDYGEALRTASLKLTGDLPTLADIKAMQAAQTPTDQKLLYEAKVDAMLADPRFVQMMIQWWRDTLKTGQQGNPAQGMPSFDSAALFAASVVINDRPYTDLFTATSGTCPTFANGTFTAAECANNAPVAGILTDPGLMAQYFSNMAFRRVRFVQETFACAKFPAEYSAKPTPMGSSLYTSPWDFSTITGGATAKINFQDTSAVICANCHTTMNHMAPLFGYFDAKGQYMANAIQVTTPVVPPVKTTLADWLPAGQGLAWRNGTAITDLPSLGQAMAKDTDVIRCAATRVWNWALSRGDVVNDLAGVPTDVTDAIYTDFAQNGLRMKRLIRNVFTSDDFVKF